MATLMSVPEWADLTAMLWPADSLLRRYSVEIATVLIGNVIMWMTILAWIGIFSLADWWQDKRRMEAIRVFTLGSPCPSYYDVVEPVLRESDGDPRALHALCPHFNARGKPNDGHDTTYMGIACVRKDLHVVRALVACGETLTHNTHCKLSPLYLACNQPRIRTQGKQNECTALVAWILSQGVSVNSRTRTLFGFTPLHTAAQYSNAAVVTMLLQHGADPTMCVPDIPNVHRYLRMSVRERGVHPPRVDTPADIARKTGRIPHIVAMLTEAAHRHQTTEDTAWRPRTAHQFTRGYRVAMCTIAVLAKARGCTALVVA